MNTTPIEGTNQATIDKIVELRHIAAKMHEKVSGLLLWAGLALIFLFLTIFKFGEVGDHAYEVYDSYGWCPETYYDTGIITVIVIGVLFVLALLTCLVLAIVRGFQYWGWRDDQLDLFDELTSVETPTTDQAPQG